MYQSRTQSIQKTLELEEYTLAKLQCCLNNTEYTLLIKTFQDNFQTITLHLQRLNKAETFIMAGLKQYVFIDIELFDKLTYREYELARLNSFEEAIHNFKKFTETMNKLSMFGVPKPKPKPKQKYTCQGGRRNW